MEKQLHGADGRLNPGPSSLNGFLSIPIGPCTLKPDKTQTFPLDLKQYPEYCDTSLQSEQVKTDLTFQTQEV